MLGTNRICRQQQLVLLIRAALTPDAKVFRHVRPVESCRVCPDNRRSVDSTL